MARVDDQVAWYGHEAEAVADGPQIHRVGSASGGFTTVEILTIGGAFIAAFGAALGFYDKSATEPNYDFDHGSASDIYGFQADQTQEPDGN